jgi:hypothetical protein
MERHGRSESDTARAAVLDSAQTAARGHLTSCHLEPRPRSMHASSRCVPSARYCPLRPTARRLSKLHCALTEILRSMMNPFPDQKSGIVHQHQMRLTRLGPN